MTKSWPPKIGVTIGKFKPMHLGHELMIYLAAKELDELTVIVSDIADDYTLGMVPEFPLTYRYNTIKDKLLKYPNVKVVKHYDTFGSPAEYDENGTGVGEEFWKYWTGVFQLLAPDANYFVSSDKYGQVAAKHLSTDIDPVEWFPVDPGRELMEISATKIRKDPMKYWKYISQEFRPKFGKRVLVVGPESTGKSTLTKDLGMEWGSTVVPEYGRILSEAKNNNMTVEDFKNISVRHRNMEIFAMETSTNGLVISDTDLYTTMLYTQTYLGEKLNGLGNMFLSRMCYDLIVLLPVTIPWDDDGTRVMPDEGERTDFFNKLKQVYRNHRNVMILNETDRKKRVNLVSIEIAKLFPEQTLPTIV